MQIVYDKLKSINVKNRFYGEIDALSAYNKGYSMAKSDERKVRHELAKLGYKCSIIRGTIQNIIKIEDGTYGKTN